MQADAMPWRYVALGDSYTIGTSVREAERWPNQLVALEQAPARREPAGTDRSLVAGDELHPSGAQYARWVERIRPAIEVLLTTDALAGVLLIAVPVLFNVAFFELGRAFEYPAILRREPGEILRRFSAGG
jgi:lysophospholipase L1-like esterase